MVKKHNTPTRELQEILRWTAGLGAVTVDAVARHAGWTSASARARLAAAERAGLIKRHRLLADAPALYTATRAGLRASGERGLEPCRVSVGGAPHAIACASAATVLERVYPDHSIMGERELRLREREAGRALASADLGRGAGNAVLHRPDLVLWPRHPLAGLPVAVEVELTVKAPQRLVEICRAWARCRCTAGTIYLAAEHVQRPLARAIETARGEACIAVLGLDALADPEGPATAVETGAAESTVPGAA